MKKGVRIYGPDILETAGLNPKPWPSTLRPLPGPGLLSGHMACNGKMELLQSPGMLGHINGK